MLSAEQTVDLATLEVVEGFQALPLHQLLSTPSSVDPRVLDVIAKGMPILYPTDGHLVISSVKLQLLLASY